jgi:hypothetical protein
MTSIRTIMTAVAAIAALSLAACGKPTVTTSNTTATTTTTATNTTAPAATTTTTASTTGTTGADGVFKYNDPPAGDQQYAACLKYSATKYEGGEQSSPVAGQSKAQAFCTCMWNETPDDFKGDLAKFSETAKGAETNKICEKHSDWHS